MPARYLARLVAATAALSVVNINTASAAFTPIVEYRFNQGAGSVAVNTGSLGAAANGTLSGGAGFAADQPTGVGFALDLNGSTAFVAVPDAWDYGTAVTVEAWVKPDAVNGQRIVFDDFGNPGVILAMFNGLAQFSLTTTADPGLGVSIFAGTVVTGSWQHLAGVYDGTQMRLYVNGVLVGTANTSGGIIDNTAGLSGGVGRDNVSPALYFDGRIDDFRVFNDALSQAELAGGAFAPTAVPEPSSLALIGVGVAGLFGVARRRAARA